MFNSTRRLPCPAPLLPPSSTRPSHPSPSSRTHPQPSAMNGFDRGVGPRPCPLSRRVLTRSAPARLRRSRSPPRLFRRLGSLRLLQHLQHERHQHDDDRAVLLVPLLVPRQRLVHLPRPPAREPAPQGVDARGRHHPPDRLERGARGEVQDRAGRRRPAGALLPPCVLPSTRPSAFGEQRETRRGLRADSSVL